MMPRRTRRREQPIELELRACGRNRYTQRIVGRRTGASREARAEVCELQRLLGRSIRTIRIPQKPVQEQRPLRGTRWASEGRSEHATFRQHKQTTPR